MLKLFSYMLDAICSLIAVLFLIGFTVLSVFLGLYICDLIGFYDGGKIALTIAFGFIGCFFGFCVDTLTFGLIANVIEIRKNLEKLNAKKD